MHIERLDEIASWLEDGAPHRGKVHEFNMVRFIKPINECGTACCIAGVAVQFHRKKMRKKQYEDQFDGYSNSIPVFAKAKNLLGLTEDVADQLFAMSNTEYFLEDVDPAWAARCIRNLIETGKVDWDSTREG
jgi:hypothetical protein